MASKFQVAITVDGNITVTYANGKSLSFGLKEIAGLDEYRQAVRAKATDFVVQSPVAEYAAKSAADPKTTCHRCGKVNLPVEVVAWSTGRKTFGFRPTCRECQFALAPVANNNETKYSLGLRCQAQRDSKVCGHLTTNERAKWSQDRFGIVVCKDCYAKNVKHFEDMAVALFKSKNAVNPL